MYRLGESISPDRGKGLGKSREKSRRLGRFFAASVLVEEVSPDFCGDDTSEDGVDITGGHPLRSAKSRAAEAEVC